MCVARRGRRNAGCVRCPGDSIVERWLRQLSQRSVFKRAESENYFSKFTKDRGLGTFAHRREPANIDKQDVIRTNGDTLYSSAVIDLDALPATVTLPGASWRCSGFILEHARLRHGPSGARACK